MNRHSLAAHLDAELGEPPPAVLKTVEVCLPEGALDHAVKRRPALSSGEAASVARVAGDEQGLGRRPGHRRAGRQQIG